MKSLVQAIAVAAVLAPTVSIAQSNAPVTRAEVRAQLIRLGTDGHNPADADNATTAECIRRPEPPARRTVMPNVLADDPALFSACDARLAPSQR